MLFSYRGEKRKIIFEEKYKEENVPKMEEKMKISNLMWPP